MPFVVVVYSQSRSQDTTSTSTRTTIVIPTTTSSSSSRQRHLCEEGAVSFSKNSRLQLHNCRRRFGMFRWISYSDDYTLIKIIPSVPTTTSLRLPMWNRNHIKVRKLDIKIFGISICERGVFFSEWKKSIIK